MGSGLLGSILGQMLGGMLRRGSAARQGSAFGGFEEIFNQSTPGAFDQTPITLPPVYRASSPLPLFLTRGRLQMSLMDEATGEPLGGMDEVGTNILAHRADGHAAVKAHRTYKIPTSSHAVADVIKFTTTSKGREVLLGIAEEHPVFNAYLLRFLNNIHTRFVISDEGGLPVLLATRWQLPFTSWFTLRNSKQELVATARMPFSPFPALRNVWDFVVDTKAFRINSSILPLLAGFATIDKRKGYLHTKGH